MSAVQNTLTRKFLEELLQGDLLDARPAEGERLLADALDERWPQWRNAENSQADFETNVEASGIPMIAGVVKPIVEAVLELVRHLDQHDLVRLLDMEPVRGMFPRHPRLPYPIQREFAVVALPHGYDAMAIWREMSHTSDEAKTVWLNSSIPEPNKFATGGKHDLRGITVERIMGSNIQLARVHLTLGNRHTYPELGSHAYFTLDTTGVATTSMLGRNINCHRFTTMGIFLGESDRGPITKNYDSTNIDSQIERIRLNRKPGQIPIHNDITELPAYLRALADDFHRFNTQDD